MRLRTRRAASKQGRSSRYPTVVKQSFQKSNAQRAQDHENKLSRRSRPFSQGGTLGHWNGRGDQDGKKGEKGRQGREEGKRRQRRIERPQNQSHHAQTKPDSSFRRSQTTEKRATTKGVRASGRRQCRVKKAKTATKTKTAPDSGCQIANRVRTIIKPLTT